MPFRALGLPPPILRALQDVGYTEPTPIQIAAIPPILAGIDSYAGAPDDTAVPERGW